MNRFTVRQISSLVFWLFFLNSNVYSKNIEIRNKNSINHDFNIENTNKYLHTDNANSNDISHRLAKSVFVSDVGGPQDIQPDNLLNLRIKRDDNTGTIQSETEAAKLTSLATDSQQQDETGEQQEEEVTATTVTSELTTNYSRPNKTSYVYSSSNNQSVISNSTSSNSTSSNSTSSNSTSSNTTSSNTTSSNSSSEVTDAAEDDDADVSSDEDDEIMPGVQFSAGAMKRGFLVFAGLSGIVLIYFVIKFVCSSRRAKYKQVSRGDEMDMYPFSEEADEDEEIFAAHRHS